MSIAVLTYTHDEYSFIWPATFPLFKKYIDPAIPVHILYNSDANQETIEKHIPSDYFHHTYDPSLIWTKRVLKALNEINEDYILFLHEDWLPIGDVKNSVIDNMLSFMKDKDCSFLLSHGNPYSYGELIPSGYEGYSFKRAPFHLFQPAIWRKDTFIKFCTDLDLTKINNEGGSSFEYMSKYICYTIQHDTTLRKIETTNSLFYPGMHVLAQGCWTRNRYGDKIRELLEPYGVDTSTRPSHTWWENGIL